MKRNWLNVYQDDGILYVDNLLITLKGELWITGIRCQAQTSWSDFAR
jgi:hypothetical protein